MHCNFFLHNRLYAIAIFKIIAKTVPQNRILVQKHCLKSSMFGLGTHNIHHLSCTVPMMEFCKMMS